MVKRVPPLGGIPKAPPSHVQKQETGTKTAQQISVRDSVSGGIAKKKEGKSFSFINFFLNKKLPTDTGVQSQVC